MNTPQRKVRNFSRQAVVALEKYLDRGKSAVELLKEGHIDEALQRLQERSEAFHNFRVADAIVRNKGDHPESVEAELNLIWEQISESDIELKELLSHEFENTKNELRHISQSKAKIGKYRSGYNEKVNFEYSI